MKTKATCNLAFLICLNLNLEAKYEALMEGDSAPKYHKKVKCLHTLDHVCKVFDYTWVRKHRACSLVHIFTERYNWFLTKDALSCVFIYKSLAILLKKAEFVTYNTVYMHFPLFFFLAI